MELVHSREHSRSRSCYGLRRRAALFAGLAILMMAVRSPAQDLEVPPEIVFQSQPLHSWSAASVLSIPDTDQLNAVQVDPELRALVRQLEDPSFEAREQATKKLIELSSDNMQLYAMLAPESDLTPEQRYRLLAALREHLLKSPRGAVGISMEIAPMMMGGPIEIRVTDVLPGLPAERVLKVNDRITQVDDQPLFAYDDLQFRVQCKRPGDKVSLTIKRPKAEPEANAGREDNQQQQFETMRVELELGSAEMLREFNDARVRLNQPLPVSTNRVDTMRIRQAKAADQNFAPKPRTVVITGHSTLIATDSSQPLQPVPDTDVENHPAVKEMLRQRKLIETGNISADELQNIRDQWDKQLFELFRQSQNRMLTSDQRDYLEAVINRCVELMQ